MNKIPVIIFLAMTTNVFAQNDTLYFNSSWEKTTKYRADYFRLAPLQKTGNLYQVKEYYRNGNLYKEGFFADKALKNPEGKTMLYYKTGQLWQVLNYAKGRLNGEVLYYSKKDTLIAKGEYKNGKPHNGKLLDFTPDLGTLTNYKNGVITGTQYVGYNDNQRLIVLDSMNYKLGKPYQGKLMEHYYGKLHNHIYDKGVLVKTVVTDDFYRDRVRNTITYSKTGFVITDKDSDFVLSNLTYLNKARTKAKVEFAPTVDEFSGSLEFHKNQITAIDVVFIDSKTTTITYTLVDTDLVVTIKSNGIVVKAFPKLEHIKKFTYRNFIDLEKLLMDGMVVLHTYIDGKKVATGVRKDTDMYDGIHIWANSKNNTYRYLKFKKGKSLDDQDDLTKKELLKLLKD